MENEDPKDVKNIATYALKEYSIDATNFLYKKLFYSDDKRKSEEYRKQLGHKVRILYVGKRAQKACLTPLLETLAKEKYKREMAIDTVEITTIGHAESEAFFGKMTGGSAYSLIEADAFLDLNIKLIPSASNEKTIKDFSFSLPFDGQHQEDSPYYFSKSGTEFDIIFCSWEFHFDLNWRLAHTHLLKHLAKGGSLVFIKTTGDSSLFDGNFKEGKTATNQALYDFMWAFDNERNKRIAVNEPIKKDTNAGQDDNVQDFFWNPEISTSDYSQMRKQAEWYFEEVVIDNETNKVYEGNLKRETLIDYFKNQAFSYLKIGVEKRITDDFAERAKNLTPNIVINKQLQYYVARGFLPDYLKNIPARHWRYNDLIKHLQELNDNDPDKLSRKALDTLVSHDIFLPQHTVSCSFFYWLGDEADHWDHPVHLINNHILGMSLRDKSAIFKQFLELMAVESLNDKGVFRYLIRDIKNKMQISFQFLKDGTDLSELKGYKGFKKGDSLVYSVRYDKKRNPISLKLAFTRDLFDEKSMGSFAKLMAILTGFEAENKVVPIKVLPIRDKIDNVRGTINRFSISKDMQTAFKKFEEKNIRIDENERSEAEQTALADLATTPLYADAFKETQLKDTFKKVFNDLVDQFNHKHSADGDVQQKIKAISAIINKVDTPSVLNPKAAEKADNEEAQLFLKVFLSIALFIWDSEDFELSFYPSAAVEDEAKYSEGLGGIVLSEKLFTDEDGKKEKLTPNQVTLLLARNNALIEASNQIFYKIGISDHVNHRYRKFALQSAVATIISRNGSHGIGSHAIPSLVNDHRDLWQRGNKEALLAALRDDDIFYKYLQDRFEFITQLGNPSLPKWTLTTWFGKDLMKRFLMQRHLLNNLASSERLRAYEFLKEGERDKQTALATDAEDDCEFLYGNVYKENGAWVMSETPSERQLIEPFKRTIEWKMGKEPDNTEGLSKIRVSGKLGVKNDELYLKDAELVTGRILIKVRLRQFLAYNEKGQPTEQNKRDTSDKISQAIHVIRHDDAEKLTLAIERKIKEKQEKEAKTREIELDRSLYFYGVVCKEYDKNKRQLTIRLGKNADTTIVLTLKNAFAESQHLRIGRRILFTDDALTMDSKNPSMAFDKVLVRELLFSKNIIHPKEDGKNFEKDIPVSIVGGIVGYQAFYSILENIIRNAAKHNWQLFKPEEKNRKNLVVTIELEDQLDEDSYICKVWTNTTDVGYKKGMKTEKDNTPISVFSEESLVEQLRTKLESPIIKKDGQPKQEDIGVSEIKICAAFLAGKDWTHTPSVLTGSKALLKHKTDREPSDKEGYIRTFVAWEAEDKALIPRLGYRFRLLKAKEFLFFMPSEQNAEDNKTTKERLKAWTNGNKASKMVTYEGKSPNLDYEYCVLIAPKKDATFSENSKKPLMSSLLKYFEAEPQPKKNDDLLRLTISYPHRLMVVCDDVETTLTNLKNQHIGPYLKRRIVFVDRKDFDKMLNDPQSDVAFWLYHQWVSFVEGRKDTFKLAISTDTDGDSSIGETARMNIPTLPFSLRGETESRTNGVHTEGANNLVKKVYAFHEKRQNVSNKGQKVLEKIPNQSNEAGDKTGENEEKSIRFARHQPYDPSTHFLESLSGGKVSFSTFANIEHIEQNECDKFFMQLMEAAQNFVLVLDERIMEYALTDNQMDSQKYNQFENANILIPTKFSINGRLLHGEEDKNEENRVEPTLAYRVKEGDKEVEKVAIWFNQKADKLNGKPWRVTTVIIHQTLLEKIIEKGANSDKVEENKDAINDFIRWLKIEQGIPGVIITSGRGKNNNTSDLAKFIPFSDISSLLMQYSPEKWMLNRIITESLH